MYVKIELLKYQYNRMDFIDSPVDLGFECPLDLHCTYTFTCEISVMPDTHSNTESEYNTLTPCFFSSLYFYTS